MFDSLQPHELKHARLPCSLLSPRACSNTCPLNQGCHPTILSSVTPFSSFLQSFPASGSFLMSCLFVSGGQVYWSFSFSISPSNEYSGLISFRIDCFDLLAVQGILKSLQHHSSKTSILQHSTFFMVQLSYPYMTTGKTIALTRWTFVSKVMFLLFNMLSKFFIAFLPRSKCLLISWLQSPSAVIWEPTKISLSLFPWFPHLFAVKWWDQMPWSYFSECWVISQLFHCPLSLSSRGSSESSSSLGAIRVVSFAYLRLLIFLPAILIPACAFIQPSVSHDVFWT